MKHLISIAIMAVALMMGNATDASAQKWLQKLNKGLDKVGTALDKADKAIDTTFDTVDQALGTDTTSTSSSTTSEEGTVLPWDTIPVYKAVVVNVVDADGNAVLNEDGTKQVRVYLEDQFGRKRSAETVKAQQKAINKCVGNIVKKVTIAVGITGITQLLAGASPADILKGVAVSTAGGLVLSANDIVLALKHRSSLKKQKKLLEAYEKNFTSEGVPIDPKVDVSTISDLGLDDSNAVSLTAEAIKSEITESSDFTDTTGGGSLDSFFD